MNGSMTTLFRASLMATVVGVLSFGCAAEPADDDEDSASTSSEVNAYLVPLKGTETATVREALNLRNGPSTQNAVKLVMPAGAKVTYAKQAYKYVKNGYWPVYYGNVGGWAYGAYLQSGGAAANQGGEQQEDFGCAGRANANYCGGNFGVQGDPNILFRCENGLRKPLAFCRQGCVAYTYVGSPDDHCR